MCKCVPKVLVAIKFMNIIAHNPQQKEALRPPCQNKLLRFISAGQFDERMFYKHLGG